MDYPKEFPLESRAAVAAEKIRAGRDFDELTRSLWSSPEREQQIRKYVLRQFLVFVFEACKVGKKRLWPVDRIEKAALEFLRLASIDAVYSKGRGSGRGWTSNTGGSLSYEVSRQFESSPEWKQYEDMMLEVAEVQAMPAPDSKVIAFPEPRSTKSYRAEVDLWMAREHIGTLVEAASRLRIDLSALKSIRSSRGKLRCSQATLDRVLNTVGCKAA